MSLNWWNSMTCKKVEQSSDRVLRYGESRPLDTLASCERRKTEAMQLEYSYERAKRMQFRKNGAKFILFSVKTTNCGIQLPLNVKA